MADHEKGDRGPLEIIGALVAIGAIGGSRGQLVLSRLKRLAARSAGISLLVAPMTLLLAFPYAAIWLGIACLGALLSCALWCNALVANDRDCVKTLPTVVTAQQKNRTCRLGDSLV